MVVLYYTEKIIFIILISINGLHCPDCGLTFFTRPYFDS